MWALCQRVSRWGSINWSGSADRSGEMHRVRALRRFLPSRSSFTEFVTVRLGKAAAGQMADAQHGAARHHACGRCCREAGASWCTRG